MQSEEETDSPRDYLDWAIDLAWTYVCSAAEYYSEFVDLWEDADPELQPQVEDVRERIARLVGEPRI
jgi:hypothetical protein